MYSDMRNFVVFRVRQEKWESHKFDSEYLDEWIRNNTIEGKPCVSLSESDFRHQYVIAGFSTESDAMALREHLQTLAFIDIAEWPAEA